MKESLTITIEVQGGSHVVVVRDSAGHVKECNSVLIVAGDERSHELYLFGWGHPRTVAWALGEGLANAQTDPWYQAFINCHTRDMAFRTMPLGRPITIDELERRWAEGEDETTH